MGALRSQLPRIGFHLQIPHHESRQSRRVNHTVIDQMVAYMDEASRDHADDPVNIGVDSGLLVRGYEQVQKSPIRGFFLLVDTWCGRRTEPAQP